MPCLTFESNGTQTKIVYSILVKRLATILLL